MASAVQLHLPALAIDMSVKDMASLGLKEIPGQFRASWQVKKACASNSNAPAIPIIDLAGLHGDRRSLIIEQIKTASEEWGFFQVCHELTACYFFFTENFPFLSLHISTIFSLIAKKWGYPTLEFTRLLTT
jgi:hypothetical protein